MVKKPGKVRHREALGYRSQRLSVCQTRLEREHVWAHDELGQLLAGSAQHVCTEKMTAMDAYVCGGDAEVLSGHGCEWQASSGEEALESFCSWAFCFHLVLN